MLDADECKSFQVSPVSEDGGLDHIGQQQDTDQAELESEEEERDHEQLQQQTGSEPNKMDNSILVPYFIKYRANKSIKRTIFLPWILEKNLSQFHSVIFYDFTVLV